MTLVVLPIVAKLVKRQGDAQAFSIDAVVVLPDHLHAIWTLLPGDTDYSLRWRLIKASLRGLPRDERRSASRGARASAQSGNGAIGSIPCATISTLPAMPITSTSIRSNSVTPTGCRIGRVLLSIALSGWAPTRSIGQAMGRPLEVVCRGR